MKLRRDNESQYANHHHHQFQCPPPAQPNPLEPTILDPDRLRKECILMLCCCCCSFLWNSWQRKRAKEGSEEGYNNKQRDNLPHHSSPPTTTTTTQRQECISFSAEEAVESSFSGCHCFSLFPVYVAVSAIYGQNILIFLSNHPITPTKPGDTLSFICDVCGCPPLSSTSFRQRHHFYICSSFLSPLSSLLYAHQPPIQPTNRTYLCFWCLTYNLF